MRKQDLRMQGVMALLIIGVFVATCTGPLDPNVDRDPLDTNGDHDQPHDPSIPPAPSNPLNVTVTLDTAGGIETTVDAGGDELRLVDGHGNVVTLLIPENAVVEETVSMTLVSSISGATLSGGLLAGVDLKPDGLQLRRPATLIIEPSDPGVISQLLEESSEYLLTAFSYHGTGGDFHYYPYRIVGNEIHLYITHFSGYGTGASNEGDRTAQQGYIPTDANARASQRIAETLTEEARKQHADPDYESTTVMEVATEALRTWLHESVLPMAEAAETNDRMLDCAVIEWLRWEAYGQVIGVIENGSPFEPERARIRSSIRKGSANAIESSHRRAVQNNDASEIERFLYLWAETQLMFDDDVVDDLDDRLMRITRFELEMESTISCTAGSFAVGVKAPRFPLLLDEEHLHLFSKGSGPIGHTDAWMECMISFSGSGCTFEADWVTIGIPPYDHPDCGGRHLARSTPDLPEPEVSMFVGQGMPIETFVLQCEGSDIPWPFTSPLWAGGFAVLHQPNYVDLMGFHIGEWEMNFAQPYATKGFDHADANVHESATYTLWYAPLP